MEIAGLTVRVENRYSYVETICRDYICPQARAAVCTVRVSAGELEEEAARAHSLGRRLYPEWYYENICIARAVFRSLLACGCLFVHSCAMSVDSDGYGLIAPVHGGKTTQLRLWQKRFGSRLQVINGDKPVYRLSDGQFMVCGTPWMGKEAAGANISVPLRALFFLEKGEICRAYKMSPAQVLGELFYHTELPVSPSEEAGMVSTVTALLARIPCFRLVCTPTAEAVDTAMEALGRR